MARSYEEVKQDYLCLESISHGGDMVEIMAEVFELMANPTKTRAKRMYQDAIEQWFSAIGVSRVAEIPLSVWQHPDVQRIAEKYGHYRR